MYIPLPILLIVTVLLGVWLHSHGFWKWPLSLRALWWVRFAKVPEEMPKDVREYILRRHMKATLAWADTFEKKRKLATEMYAGALQLENDQISPEMRDEMIATSFKLLDGYPTGECSVCLGRIYLEEAKTVNGALYCKNCAPKGMTAHG